MRADEREHKGDAPGLVDFYDSTYARFRETLYQDIRRYTWDEDIGQNGWITASEQDRIIGWLSLGPGKRLLDIGCGAGGPTLRIAERTGATVVGVDIHADGINEARRQTATRKLEASFQTADAREPLPFAESSFDAVLCVDAINHLSDRPRLLADWSRVLKRAGRLVFTDPLIVSGPLTREEIAIRASIGSFLFVAPDTDERMLADAGLRLIVKEDLTEAMARTAERWYEARQRRAAELKRIEGETTFDGQQRFLDVAARIAKERRLSRFAYVAVK